MSAPRPMPLFTQEQRAKLLANGRATLADPSFDPWPVVKLFAPDGAATWLVTEIDPEEPNCQSASKIAPGSASKIDPGVGWWRGVSP